MMQDCPGGGPVSQPGRICTNEPGFLAAHIPGSGHTVLDIEYRDFRAFGALTHMGLDRQLFPNAGSALSWNLTPPADRSVWSEVWIIEREFVQWRCVTDIWVIQAEVDVDESN